jgi:two-component system, NtrC family, response regulator HydG
MTGVLEPVALVGQSGSIELVRREIESAARCDAKVLITGESGVGKEVVARLIHAGSRRSHAPLVTVNCAALTDTLLETELFGHVRGSFTGAYRDRVGALQQANRGTVFMDEVGETTQRMQGLLLRFLESGEIQRVGSDRPESRVDVRVITATNRDLFAGVHDRSFREDLYYRLRVIHIAVPPLRMRLDDLDGLLSGFLDQFARQYGLPTPRASEETLRVLKAHPWPGNVRELRNLAERLVARGHHGPIEPHHLPDDVGARPVGQQRPAMVLVEGKRTRVDEAFHRMIVRKESFWTAVYPVFMGRDLTRDDLQFLVRRGLERTSGSYRVLVQLFNMPVDDYKRFLNFLNKHRCHVAFQPFRAAGGRMSEDVNGSGEIAQKVGATSV